MATVLRAMQPATAFVLLCMTAGCGADQPTPGQSVPADTTEMELAWVVAPREHPAADSLGDVSGLALDDEENLYVSDRLAAKIWVFGQDGLLRRSIGGQGEGPGEFQAPTGVSVGPDGRLYVRDVYRVTVFGREEGTGLLCQLETTFNGPLYADWTSKRATRFDSTGAMLYPGDRWREDGTAAPYVFRFESGELTDSIFVPTYTNAPQLTAHYRTGPGGGRMLPGLNRVPFTPIPAWDIHVGSTIVSGDARTYELVVTDFNGVVLDTLGRSLEPLPIPPAERADSIDALRTRLDSVPVPLDDVEGMPESVRALEVPEVYPAYRAVYGTVDGEIWVRRWVPSSQPRSVFDVFADGEYQRTILLPRRILDEPTPYLSRSIVIGVTTDPFTDEYIVMRFAVED